MHSRGSCQVHLHRKRALVGDLADLRGRLKPREEEDHLECAKRVEIGQNSREEIHLSYFLNPFPPNIYFTCSPLILFLCSPAALCMCSVALTVYCSAMSSRTPRPAARPFPARRPAARPGQEFTACGTPPRRPVCLGKATLSALNSSSSPPATRDHVGDAAVALKCRTDVTREANPR